MSTQLEERKCPICKKIFVPAPFHSWRVSEKGAMVCSYHCVLESDRRKEERRKATRKYIKRDERGVTEK